MEKWTITFSRKPFLRAKTSESVKSIFDFLIVLKSRGFYLKGGRSLTRSIERWLSWLNWLTWLIA